MKTLNVKLPGTPEKEQPKAIQVRTTGGRGKVTLHDLIQGAISAAIGAALAAASDALATGSLDWKKIAAGAAIAGLSYIGTKMKDPKKIVIKASELEQ